MRTGLNIWSESLEFEVAEAVEVMKAIASQGLYQCRPPSVATSSQVQYFPLSLILTNHVVVVVLSSD